ncbi:mediator of RNA polymerase II transcription subunit 21-like isoform X2 [Paramacrobiotus metropolitanus]|uniref:mediator of RNA polymerase II transcription subunit 21-like isoform X2 n=1 Tax=Paramacrobiotus metropolitanus TaxID=2943436 RepID=UPI0024457876|nr:mediator of RNA polymerase II transcription subunit 21-like isoform X2 [Paramacrobiotus metropolitanus]XP_055332798.1 mediator of RNA polymerase II transcription subunit 21-like isoform X2 [Paramacrobiotus metropolitanus]
MCDRITQLQDHINQLAEQMCNAIGILQQTAPPSSLPGFDKLLSPYAKTETGEIPPEDFPALFATLITRSARDVDYLIDQLPADDANLELQINAIKRTDGQSKDAVRNLMSTVKNGHDLLSRIQAALADIAECEIQIRKLDI